MYDFGHPRTAKQYETAWHELSAAIGSGDENEAGLLLAVSGDQLLLDGTPLESAQAERSFARMLSAAGIASIHFAPKMTQASLARLVKGFPTGTGSKPNLLAEQLKASLEGDPHVHVNEVCFVPADSAVAKSTMAATIAAHTLGMNSAQTEELLNDPNKLLQLIVAAEGSKKLANGGGRGGDGDGYGDSEGNGEGNGNGGNGNGRKRRRSGRRNSRANGPSHELLTSPADADVKPNEQQAHGDADADERGNYGEGGGYSAGPGGNFYAQEDAEIVRDFPASGFMPGAGNAVYADGYVSPAAGGGNAGGGNSTSNTWNVVGSETTTGGGTGLPLTSDVAGFWLNGGVAGMNAGGNGSANASFSGAQPVGGASGSDSGRAMPGGDSSLGGARRPS